ncbi:hypothetical protein TNCV_1399561 [Trichonephila clavipes]|nr:hypothetical protein TNCV_1399561 [Trichonephila clavipes]
MKTIREGSDDLLPRFHPSSITICRVPSINSWYLIEIVRFGFPCAQYHFARTRERFSWRKKEKAETNPQRARDPAAPSTVIARREQRIKTWGSAGTDVKTGRQRLRQKRRDFSNETAN